MFAEAGMCKNLHPWQNGGTCLANGEN